MQYSQSSQRFTNHRTTRNLHCVSSLTCQKLSLQFVMGDFLKSWRKLVFFEFSFWPQYKSILLYHNTKKYLDHKISHKLKFSIKISTVSTSLLWQEVFCINPIPLEFPYENPNQILFFHTSRNIRNHNK